MIEKTTNRLEQIKADRKWITLQEAAVYMSVSYSTARKRWQEWDVAISRPEGKKQLLFKRSDLDRYIESNRIK